MGRGERAGLEIDIGGEMGTGWGKDGVEDWEDGWRKL